MIVLIDAGVIVPFMPHYLCRFMVASFCPSDFQGLVGFEKG